MWHCAVNDKISEEPRPIRKIPPLSITRTPAPKFSIGVYQSHPRKSESAQPKEADYVGRTGQRHSIFIA